MSKQLAQIALEDLTEVTPDEEEIYEIEFPGPDGNMVQGLIDDEAVAAIKRADEESKEIDQLISVSTTMESIRDNLMLMPAAKPLSLPVAQALESLLQQMTDRSQKFFSMEHFHGKEMRKIGTKLAIEDLSESIRITIAKIVRWIKRAFQVVFEHVESIIRGANATGKKAEALQDAAARVKAQYGDNDTSDGQIKNSNLAKFFVKPGHGESMSAQEIVEAYNHFCGTFNQSLSEKSAVSGCQFLGAQIHKILTKNKAGGFTKEIALELSDETIRHMVDQNFSEFNKDTSHDKLTYTTPFGGIEFIVSITKDGDKLSGMSFVKSVPEKGSGEMLPVLRPSEVAKLAEAVEASMHRGIYRDYKKVRSALFDLQKSISDMCDEVSRQQRGQVSGTIPSIHFLKTVAETMFDLVRDVYGYNGQTARAILSYGQLSLKEYTSKSKSNQPETKENP